MLTAKCPNTTLYLLNSQEYSTLVWIILYYLKSSSTSSWDCCQLTTATTGGLQRQIYSLFLLLMTSQCFPLLSSFLETIGCRFVRKTTWSSKKTAVIRHTLQLMTFCGISVPLSSRDTTRYMIQARPPGTHESASLLTLTAKSLPFKRTPQTPQPRSFLRIMI